MPKEGTRCRFIVPHHVSIRRQVTYDRRRYWLVFGKPESGLSSPSKLERAVNRIAQLFLVVFLTLNCAAADHPEPRKPGAEEERLKALVGEWIVSGEEAKSRWGPARRISGKQTVRMRLDGLCLEVEDNLVFGDSKHDSLSLVTYSQASKNYSMVYFSSIAPTALYSMTVESGKAGDVWKSSWTETNEGDEFFYRETRTILPSKDGWTYRVEYSQNNEIWKVLYACRGRRVNDKE